MDRIAALEAARARGIAALHRWGVELLFINITHPQKKFLWFQEFGAIDRAAANAAGEANYLLTIGLSQLGVEALDLKVLGETLRTTGEGL